ncbi:MAG: alpha/beta hydrolase [Oscillospiraceae bacterium]|nr:alpha/beta hydrolase [Oscillospiraceae bacterium]
MFSARNAKVNIGGSQMDYIRFGRGKKTLIMLPGLGDGLRTVKGTALPMSFLYRNFAKDYTVYMFSRKNNLAEGVTTRDMADDMAAAMDVLGIEKAVVVGVSMGGMIAQHLAADHPEKVEKLVLVVTAPKANSLMNESVEEWARLAERQDHTAFMDSNVRLIYSDAYYRKNKWLIPITGAFTKPKSYHRFFLQAKACLTHDAAERLEHIVCPTLVIGGGQDRVLGVEASKELADRIPNAKLYIYPQWGHGLYEEADDFNNLILDFLR